MTVTKESLRQARELFDASATPSSPMFIDASRSLEAAARFVERLLPAICQQCYGTGSIDLPDPRIGGTEDAFDEMTCPTCHGTGQLWDEGLVEVVAKAISEGFGSNTEWSLMSKAEKTMFYLMAYPVLAALTQEVGK